MLAEIQKMWSIKRSDVWWYASENSIFTIGNLLEMG